jgi:hypothetical protein
VCSTRTWPCESDVCADDCDPEFIDCEISNEVEYEKGNPGKLPFMLNSDIMLKRKQQHNKDDSKAEWIGRQKYSLLDAEAAIYSAVCV